MAAILVVDDDPDVLQTIGCVVRKAGHAVATASGGIDALGLLEKGERFDLLLTDVVMPGLNGFNLARMAKLRLPRIKVLYLSGYHEQVIAQRDQGERLGKLLMKPILPDELRNEVGTALCAKPPFP